MWLKEQSSIERSKISSSKSKSKTPKKNPGRLIQAALTEACVIHTDVNTHNFTYSHLDKITKVGRATTKKLLRWGLFVFLKHLKHLQDRSLNAQKKKKKPKKTCSCLARTTFELVFIANGYSQHSLNERRESGAVHLHLQSVLAGRGALSLCENRACFVQGASLGF